MMYYLTLLLWLSCMTIVSETTSACDGVVFQGEYHDKELLFDGMGKAYNLAIHRFANLLFFSHLLRNTSQVDFGVKACHLEKKICRHVPGISGGYAIASDRRYDDIYLGGHNGLYKYNFRTRAADFFAARNQSIWVIMIEKYFYYVEYPSQKLYVYTRGQFEKVTSTMNIEIDKFFISKHQKIYFSNSTGLFKVDRSFKTPYLLKSKFQVRQISEDMYGEVYFATHDGIYMEMKTSKTIKKIADINQVYGITFLKSFLPVKDELIFSDPNGIFILKQSNYKQLCSSSASEDRRQQQYRINIIE